jgi:hypothetical protein
MSTAEFHWLCGKYIAERQKALGQTGKSLLATCHEYDVPGLHVVAGRLVHRHERGRRRAAGN